MIFYAPLLKLLLTVQSDMALIRESLEAATWRLKLKTLFVMGEILQGVICTLIF